MVLMLNAGDIDVGVGIDDIDTGVGSDVKIVTFNE
jgi:hypothetical protein